MPTYLYVCNRCGNKSEIIKSIHDASREEICPTCSISLDKVYTPPILIGTRVENAEWNYGLGQVIRNSAHRKEVAKQKGLIEVGNESLDTLRKESVEKRAKEREKEWDKL